MPDSVKVSWLNDPGKWVPLLALLGGLIGVYVSQVLATNQNSQSIQNNQAATLQALQDIRGTIAEMKAYQIPKRTQSLEDNFGNMQQSYNSQFQAIQQSIQATQAAQSTATQALQATLKDLTTQLAAQGQQIALMGLQIQYLLPPTTAAGKKEK